MRRGGLGPGGWIAAAVLGVLHLGCLGADFVAPYEAELQHRAFGAYRPPTAVRFVDEEGGFHLRPFIYAGEVAAGDGGGTRQRLPLRFFARGEPRRLVGPIFVRTRLVSVEEPGGLFLLGTDAVGRDRFSRLVYGGRISLFSGLLAAALSVSLGLALGIPAGFYRGWADRLLMRVSELFLALPWLYLLLGARAFLPLDVDPGRVFVLFISLIGVIGWARPARLFRGVALAARRQEYVEAARSGGAGDLRVLAHHVAPQVRGVAVTQLTLLVPQYILAEVTLSFLGLGVAEPRASWGTLLADLQQFHVLAANAWMMLPALALVVAVLAYQVLADELGSAGPRRLARSKPRPATVDATIGE